MTINYRVILPVLFVSFGLGACSGPKSSETSIDAQSAIESGLVNSPVAADILFLVLGKMSLYNQSPAGEISLRDHHFVAEIMPKAGREIISGTLTSANDATQVFDFQPEGNAFLAHGARVMNPSELHELHPDGDYVFQYETQSGRMDRQVINLTKRDTIEQMPLPATVSLSQDGSDALPMEIDPASDLTLSWEPMPGNTRVASSDLDDLIFVLVFDCFGNNVAHSGRPYQGGPYLTYKDAHYVVDGADLNPGLQYMAIVEQATADVSIYQGVPGIATYATLTFVDFKTSGAAAGQTCP